MALTLEDVRRVARLCRLDLSTRDEARMREQLDAILGYMERLQSLDTSDVEPLAHVHDVTCPQREDEVTASLTGEWSGTPFCVPKVIGGE